MFEMLTKKYNYCAGSERLYTSGEKADLIEACVGKSINEAQREFVKRNPEIEKREVIRLTSEDRLRVSHSLSVQVEEKLQRIKTIWSHVDCDMSREALLDRMADLVLKKIDPEIKLREFEAKQANTEGQSKTITENEEQPIINSGSIKIDTFKKGGFVSTDSSAYKPVQSQKQTLFHLVKRSRAIPKSVKRIVLKKNKSEGCAFVHEHSGQRCGSKFQLQFDHIKPFVEGGAHESENLRMYCAQHNRWRTRTDDVSESLR